MEWMKNFAQRLRRLHRPLRRPAGFATTDLLIGSAGFVIFSVAVVQGSITALNEMRYGPAQSQAQKIAQAVAKFYFDTGKWPGQVEQGALASGANPTTVLLASDPDSADLPKVAEFGLRYGAATCQANSLAGFVSESFTAYASDDEPTFALGDNDTPFRVLDLKDFLVNNPKDSADAQVTPNDTAATDPDAAVDYPGWGGQSGSGYVTEADILQDSWRKSWIVYLVPLMCSELVTEARPQGQLGYAWVLSGGTNETITTDLYDAELDPFGDDAGAVLGKLTPLAVE